MLSPPSKKARLDAASYNGGSALRGSSSALLDAETTLRRGYSAGAVISMHLVDFQVARDSTYLFEPFLNVILGSNGSGKSTVITAMFVLFRGRIADLQHKYYSEFVRHGCRKAVVSVVIQGKTIQSSTNPVLAVEISAQPGSTSARDVKAPQWFINGTAVSTADLDAFIAEYNVQVGNLCQFLPQFRVSAFCTETKEQRLVSTETAVGYAGMAEDHTFLSAIDKEIGEVGLDLDELQALVTRLEARKAELEIRLQRVEKAVAEKKNIEFLEKVLCLLEWNKLKSTLDALETNLHSARNEVENFDENNAASTNAIQECRQRISELKLEIRDENSSLNDYKGKVSSSVNGSRVRLEKVTKLAARLKSQVSEFKQALVLRDENKQVHARELVERQDLNAKLEKIKSPDFEKLVNLREQYKSQERDIRLQLDAGREKLGDLKSRQARVKAQAEIRQRQVSKLERSVNSPREVEKVQDVLYFDKGAISRAVRFVRANKDRFEKEVIEPAILTLSISNPAVLPMFAAVMRPNNLTKFVCQTENDQRKLAQLASQHNILLASVRINASSGTSSNSVDETTLRSLGFDGMMIDVLSGPEPMLEYMRLLRLNEIPYALNSLTDEQRSVIRRSHEKFSDYVDREQYNRVSTSRYGQQKKTELSEKVKQAPLWARFMLERDHTPELERAQLAYKNELSKLAEIEAAVQTQQTQQDELIHKRDDLATRRKELMASMREEENLTMRIERSNLKINKMAESIKLREHEASKLEQQVSKLRKHLTDAITALPSTDKAYKSVETAIQHQKRLKLNSARIEDFQNQSNALKLKLGALRKELQVRFQELASEKAKFVEEHKHDYKRSQEALKWIQKKGLKEKADEVLETQSRDDVRTEIMKLTDGLALTDQESCNFESLKLQMDNTSTQLSESKAKLQFGEDRKSQLLAKAASVRTRWEQALETIVSTASEEFARMFHQLGCKGYIMLSKDDENAVGTWGIDIYVAFRVKEEPSKLSRARQSGGERAVSTAVYLLALQQLTKAPFRVLDEINQGMDESNERKTLGFFVEHACNAVQGKAQQYFLVSPKLIPNIPVHKRMNVVFITGSTSIGDSERLIPSTEREERARWLQYEAEDPNADV